MAAVKACGEEALLSDRAAGYLLGLLKGGIPKPEVTAPTERRVKGVATRLRAAGVPLPEANRVASERRVDLRRPGRLTVELVSYRFHNSRHSWERDHDRRREARARGEEFRAYTWTDVTAEAASMIAEIRGLVVA